MQDSLEEKDLPAWYVLGTTENGLFISLHSLAVDLINERLKADAPMIKMLQEDLDLPPFIVPSEEKWGFGEVMIVSDCQEYGWMKWHFDFPYSTADGIPWQELWKISATLNMLFFALRWAEIGTDTPYPQFLTIEQLSTERRQNGGSLWATLSPSFCKWLSQQPDDSEHQSTVQIMRDFDRAITGKESLSAYRFSAWIRHPKWLNLSVPGDACGLDPKDYYNKDLDRGYEFLPHNVDSPLQQLILLSGLANLYQTALNDLNSARPAK